MVAQEDPTRRRHTVDEWRALLCRSSVKYEYHDGWLVAMAGGGLAHGAIAINVIRALQDGLRDRPCWVHNSDVAVRLGPNEYRFPDVSVSCDERDRPRRERTEVEVPCVIVEVLSEGTEKEDRTTKFALYRACPSVQEYVLVNTDTQLVEVFRRGEPRWTYQSYGPDDNLPVECLGVELHVASLYWRTDVPRNGPALSLESSS